MTDDKKRLDRRRAAGKSALISGAGGAAGMVWGVRAGEVQTGLVLLLLGILAGAALLYLPVQQEKQEKDKRARALQADYAALVTRLGLYMTAGLSLRSSWERIVRDYQEDRRAGSPTLTKAGSEEGSPLRIVYEEMDLTRRQIIGGVYEDRAYADFGRRCGLPEYLRLGSLLETYVQQGNRDLFTLLEQEAANALAADLMRVKKRGEQAGTLLLLPILILFGLTLLLVVVPAFMQMQTTW